MGWGDFGSNGSVHWRIHYHDNDRNPGSPPVVSGIDGGKKHPRAGTSQPNIGKQKGSKKEHDGKFRVTGRFESALEAFNAAVTALANLHENPEQARKVIQDALRTSGGRLAEKDVIFDVNVWPSVRNENGVFDPPEVSVDW
jgi:hypothetical protein